MYGSSTVAVNGCTSQPTGTLAAQEWDGTCWSAGANPSNPDFRSRGTQQTGTTGWFFGAYPASPPPTSSNVVEEYSMAAAATVTVTSS